MNLTSIARAARRLFSPAQAANTKATTTIYSGWLPNIVRESFPGAWQSAVTIDKPGALLAFSGIYSPLTLIAQDISKLPLVVKRRDAAGIWREERAHPWRDLLRRPNHYQHRLKFIEQWIVSKLLYGNTYVLLVRDARGVVDKMCILDPQRVVPLVADSGDIYYRLSSDNLSGLPGEVVVPAREIIHDTMVSLWHPLIGVSPLYAAGLSATQGRKIQSNSATFFQNMSRPSGMLTAPGLISDETALRLKSEWETNFSGGNAGRMAVLGDGLKYEAMTIPADQAQLIEQLEWTVRDIAACFHMPLFKVGGPVPNGLTVEALNLQYYADCLQSLIESAEACLAEGLGLGEDLGIEFDISGLARMDTVAQYEALKVAISGGWLSPNEARARQNLPPVAGGDSPMLQQQNFSLAALAKRDAKEDPFTPGAAGNVQKIIHREMTAR